MKRNVGRGIIFWITLLHFFVSQVRSDGEPPKYYEESPGPIKVTDQRFVSAFRTIAWCVNGYDEPEFQDYPLNEFVPLLQKTESFRPPKNDEYRYQIQLKKVKLTKPVESFRSSGELLNTAHFVFSVDKKRYYAQGVSERFEPSPIEGLIVQVNYAPYGIGHRSAHRFISLPRGSSLL